MQGVALYFVRHATMRPLIRYYVCDRIGINIRDAWSHDDFLRIEYSSSTVCACRV